MIVTFTNAGIGGLRGLEATDPETGFTLSLEPDAENDHFAWELPDGTFHTGHYHRANGTWVCGTSYQTQRPPAIVVRVIERLRAHDRYEDLIAANQRDHYLADAYQGGHDRTKVNRYLALASAWGMPAGPVRETALKIAATWVADPAEFEATVAAVLAA